MPSAVLEYERFEDQREFLHEAVLHSLLAFGFFTSHAPRYLEYPWVIKTAAHAGVGHAVDIGAGLSPIPLMLAARGWQVTTVDYSDARRNLSAPGKLNEWGFLDYSAIDSRIRSLNQDFAQVDFAAGSCDLVYSVSVIEHMPASTRRGVFAVASSLLAPGGRMVLTLDLEPRTMRLWNVDRGKIVEDAALHGDMDNILEELRGQGLEIVGLAIHRALPGASTDIALLEVRKQADSVPKRLHREKL